MTGGRLAEATDGPRKRRTARPAAAEVKLSAREKSSARQRVLNAARAEFAAKGFAGASIRGITAVLGMRESSFYAHFRSKQAAYDELFHEAGPSVIVELASALNTEKPMREELECFARRAMEQWTSAEAQASTSILLREAFGDSRARRDQLLAGIGKALHVLQAKLQIWQRRGEVVGDAHAEVLAFEFMAPLIVSRLLFYSASSSKEEALAGRMGVERHVDTFLTLIAGGGAKAVSRR